MNGLKGASTTPAARLEGPIDPRAQAFPAHLLSEGSEHDHRRRPHREQEQPSARLNARAPIVLIRSPSVSVNRNRNWNARNSPTTAAHAHAAWWANAMARNGVITSPAPTPAATL